MIKKVLFAAVILTATISLSGCIKIGQKTAEPSVQGGVFVSGDKGETWVRKVDLMTPGSIPGLIGDTGDVNVVEFKFDPTDSRYLYMGTAENGLFYSNNNGKGWIADETINSGFIRGIGIDPKAPCTVYVGVNTRLMKTTTCGRFWEETYKVPLPQLVTAVGVDYYNTNIVYVGLDTGDLLKSVDSGKNWERVKNFSSRVNNITFDKDDSRIIYIGTEKNYLSISRDAAGNFESTKEAMADFKDSARAIEVAQDAKSGELYYATGFGILRSKDKGVSWEEVKLITVPAKTDIYSMAINPKNGNEIYYATPTNVYRSVDAGATWSTWRLPTTRTGRAMAVHPDDGNVVYLGVRLYEE
ncbi:MAG: VPS10 domain-containing protein [Patescibacteria group bacterium]